MYKAESVRENETYKILSDFEIQMNHKIPARRPDPMLYNKKKECLICFLCHKVKLKKIDHYLNHVRQLKGL